MYYSYCTANGIEFHETSESAEARCAEILDAIKHEAADSDWTWDERGEDISWGLVAGKVKYSDRNLSKKEKAENPDWNFVRSADIVSLA